MPKAKKKWYKEDRALAQAPPTTTQIKRRTAKIREGWTEWDYIERQATYSPYTIPVIKVSGELGECLKAELLVIDHKESTFI